MDLKGKTAIVTGASTGIGRAVALSLAKQGVFVFLVARRKDKLANVKKTIKSAGGNAEVIQADLSKLESVEKLTSCVKTKAKSIHIIANIAGVWHGENKVYADTDFENFSEKIILETMSVGITAPVILVHQLLKLMPRKSKVINLSGTFENGAKGWLSYYISKRAIEDFTVGLAEELKERKIQVNCISPSDTATEAYAKYFPQYMDEAIDPVKISNFIVDLCKDRVNFKTGDIFVMKKGNKPYKEFHG